MTEKTPEKKRRGLTFPTDPLAVMQMDEIDAMARRAENDQNIVSSDATAPPLTSQDTAPDHMAGHMAENTASNVADQPDGNTDVLLAVRPESQTAGNMSTKPYGQTDILPASDQVREKGLKTPPPATGRNKNAVASGVSQTERESRLSKAMQVIEENDLVNITVRIPAKFNGFLDEYVDRLTRANPKRRYKKQDAIAEALALFIADHPMPAMPATQDDF